MTTPTTEENKLLDIPVQNDLAQETRQAVIPLLNARLADAIDLQTQCKQAHWNVKGPDFIALHKLFDEINESVEEYIDDIAERVVQLGGESLGTARLAAARSSLPEYPTGIRRGMDHAAALSASLAAFGRNVREAIDLSEEQGDAVTCDMFTEVSRGIDKWLWFVEAHLQAPR